MKELIPKEILDRITWKHDAKMPRSPKAIKKLEYDPKPCEDCGQTVVDRRIRISIAQNNQTVPHQKRQCQVCKLYKNPTTGKFDCTFQDINNHFQKGNFKKD